MILLLREPARRGGRGRTVLRVPRQPRLQIAGGTYHVTAQACASRSLFQDAHDHSAFLAILGKVVERLGWKCLSFCLMTTHYHLMLVTPEENLAVGMQRLNTLYAMSFNRRHAGVGHVFASRYHSEFIQSDAHLLEVCRYIALNPVRAGLCVAAEDWRWSSYAQSIGGRPELGLLATKAVLRLFGDDLSAARARFRRFVEDGASLRGLTP
jgi:putative transposase